MENLFVKFMFTCILKVTEENVARKFAKCFKCKSILKNVVYTQTHKHTHTFYG